MIIFIEGSKCSKLDEIIEAVSLALIEEGRVSYLVEGINTPYEDVVSPTDLVTSKANSGEFFKLPKCDIIFIKRATPHLATCDIPSTARNRRDLIEKSLFYSYIINHYPYPDYIFNIITHIGTLPILGKSDLYMEDCREVHRKFSVGSRNSIWADVHSRCDSGADKSLAGIAKEILTYIKER